MMRLSLLFALLLALPGLAQSARELNTEGFRHYQAGRYPEALEKFQAATRADPRYALAHYNVAATLGVLRKQGLTCAYEAYRANILAYLDTAVRLDPRRLKRAAVDADLDPIRDTLGWQRLLGRSPERVADVPVLLREVTWYGPGLGAYGTLRRLRFLSGGRVLFWQRHIQEEGPPRDEEVSGTYRLRGRSVEVRLPGRPRLTGTLNERGVLELEALGPFTDSPAECDA